MGGIISYWSSSTSNSMLREKIIENHRLDIHSKERKKRKKEHTITHGPICYKQQEQMFHHYACISEICQCPSGIVTNEVNKHQEYFRYRRTGKD
jgi:hypothetical protein